MAHEPPPSRPEDEGPEPSLPPSPLGLVPPGLPQGPEGEQPSSNPGWAPGEALPLGAAFGAGVGLVLGVGWVLVAPKLAVAKVVGTALVAAVLGALGARRLLT